ncbi:MAG: dephospho-CoA kinase [Phycisphaerae bacterium]|nr:dephospho-CoA kinase [Phycisphaerae bacterium]
MIGLTGQIGAGKTTVAAMFRELGCAVINADDLARAVLSEGEGVRFVREAFGPQYIRPDGTVDRRAVADLVFNDPRQKDRLEGYIYPILHRRREALTAQYQADPAVRAIILETPLLLEKGLKSLCDYVILVEADLDVRLKRVGAARRWDPEELRRREKFFFPVHLKRALADDIVYNNSSADVCRQQVGKAFSRIVSSEDCRLA